MPPRARSRGSTWRRNVRRPPLPPTRRGRATRPRVLGQEKQGSEPARQEVRTVVHQQPLLGYETDGGHPAKRSAREGRQQAELFAARWKCGSRSLVRHAQGRGGISPREWAGTNRGRQRTLSSLCAWIRCGRELYGTQHTYVKWCCLSSSRVT